MLVEESLQSGRTIRAICEDKFRDFHHGLELIERRSGRHAFEFTEADMENPGKALSEWIVASFRGQGEDAEAEESGSAE